MIPPQPQTFNPQESKFLRLGLALAPLGLGGTG